MAEHLKLTEEYNCMAYSFWCKCVCLLLDAQICFKLWVIPSEECS